MNTKDTHTAPGTKGVTLSINGHSVSLSFAAEHNQTAAERVRACLIDSYIQQTGAETHQSA